MIKLKNIHIKNFRGIKDLNLALDGESWLIHGANGSGKSGVIDALEFSLSGKITRLTGAGRKGVSIKSHGPHVDSRDRPEEAEVIVTCINLDTAKEVTFSRNCKDPTKVVFPGEKGKKVITYSNEMVLSRREVLRFILAEPGQRAKEVQTLLKLEKLEEIRSALQKVSNKHERDFKTKESQMGLASKKMLDWLKIDELKKEKVLNVINEKRANCGVDKIECFEKDTSFIDGLDEAKKADFSIIKSEMEDLWLSFRGIFTFSNELFLKETKDFKEACEGIALEKGVSDQI